jgi:hypothetical protein
VLAAAFRAKRRRSAGRTLAAAVATFGLAIVWSAVGQDVLPGHGGSGRTGALDVAAPDHVHSVTTLEDDVLVSSEELARHLVHLNEADLVVTESQRETAALLLEATRLEAPLFADVRVAEATGYVNLSSPSADRGLTYLYDRDFVRQQAGIDPQRPQMLVYLRAATASGADLPSLGGVAFIVPTGEGPRLGGGLTIWSPHGDLCVDDAELVVTRRERQQPCPDGSVPLGWSADVLRVWLLENPNGPFAGRLTHEALSAFQEQLDRKGRFSLRSGGKDAVLVPWSRSRFDPTPDSARRP